ncbi:BlaI/MecI/CopY family transcriptional regulator [Cryobacterium sp. PH29-G1]|uniref:BlaI/MecI/CopY family transcriptional regulator n=1 Tax=Cryobacterium sp. PH29-G1 TaxID=3046211 RepID=UPI0024B8FF60|nr:BlaI/MecI/CopY family transcriptional regulator [Cryobacterium sp. PH29-G1]MDJ0348364.1 BlaI/MecI/CopY family transcriptional regulator [Cryobacterium sp. PH29-G1]
MSASGIPKAFEPLRLGALEKQVMDVLWDQGPSTIRSIIENLPSDPAYTTIATVLGNLERKELVTPKRDQRSVRYASRHTREEHAALLMTHALAGSSDHAASMLHFIDAISPSDIELLRTYLGDRNARHA